VPSVTAALLTVLTTGFTFNMSVAAATLLPPFVVVKAPAIIVFSQEPGVELVTVTVTVQLLLAGIVPPASATEVPLLAAVTVPPVHVVLPAGVAEFVICVG
jgi:hypothetical protein